MPLTEAFYFQQRSSENNYSYVAQGELNVDRLIQQKAAWKQPNSAAERKKKTIVLADWTAGNWSQELLSERKKTLTKLLDDGFNIYLWQNPEFLTLNKETIDRLDDKLVRYNMAPCSHRSILENAVKDCHLISDEVCILDDYLFNVIQESEMTSIKSRELNISDVSASIHDPIKVLSMLENAEPPLRRILQTEFSENSCEIIKQLRDHTPTVSVQKKIKVLKLNQRQLAELLQVGKVTLFNQVFSLDQLSDIEALYITDIDYHEENHIQFFENGTLETILKKGNIQSLHIGSVELSSDMLKQLKTVKLNESSFESLSANKKCLTILNHDEASFEAIMKDIKPSLDTIESLEIIASTLSAQQLYVLLQSVPRLKSLKIVSCEVPKTLPGQIDFSQLEELQVQGCRLDKHDQLFEKMDNTNNIKKMTFVGTKLPVFFMEKFDLSGLESLEINDCFTYNAMVIRALKNMPHLKELTLNRSASGGEWYLQDEIPHRSPSITNSLELIMPPLPTDNQVDIADLLKDVDLSHLVSFYSDDTELSEAEQNLLFQKAKNMSLITATSTRQSYISQLTEHAVLKGVKCYCAPRIFDIVKQMQTMEADNREQPNDEAILNNYMSIKPKTDDFHFKYNPSDHTLSQQMMMDKFSQYLVLINQFIEFIPKIQDGICNALTRLFNESDLISWDRMISEISAWNGNENDLTMELTGYFERILEKFKAVYVHQSTEHTFRYVGDQIEQVLLSNQGSYLISNPWHTIAVKYLSESKLWTVYDPNYEKGYKSFAKVSDVIDEIRRSDVLGHLLEMNSSQLNSSTSMCPRIDDGDKFISSGGLLTLSTIEPNDSEMIIDQLNQMTLSIQKIHSGLMLRNVLGKPAWVLALNSNNSKLSQFVIKLLNKCATHMPGQYEESLAISLSAMSSRDKHFCVEQLVKLGFKDAANAVSIHTLRDAMHKKESPDTYVPLLETWKKKPQQAESTKLYVQRLTQVGKAHQCNRLIEVGSSQTADAMCLALQSHCHHINRPFYYINSPDDLICMAPYITRVGDQGVLKKGPGGPLFDFLTASYNADNPPVLVVNYDHFSASDIVRLNTLIDEKRRVDQTSVPESLILVGVISPNKPGCYQGEDFYSRFGVGNVQSSSFTVQQLLPSLTPVPTQNDPNADVAIINLCHSSDWKDRLMGAWVMQKDKLIFKEGLLAQALATGKPIEIVNGLWQTDEFTHFWNQARTLGYIESHGRKLDVSKAVFVESNGYDWQKLKSNLVIQDVMNLDSKVLNPSKLGDYFLRYECNNVTHQLEVLDGLIASHRGRTLQVTITCALSDDQWGDLLIECQKHKVILNCHLAPGVSLPDQLGLLVLPTAPVPMECWNQTLNAATTVIQSTDIDATVSMMTDESQKWTVIDISECLGNDLLTNIDTVFDAEKLIFEFTESNRALINALQTGNVILKGEFSQQLADALAPFLLNRMKPDVKESHQLILVTSDASSLNYTSVVKHEVTAIEKKKILEKRFDMERIQSYDLNTMPLCECITRLNYPDLQVDPWKGLQGLSGGIQVEAIDWQHSEKKAKEFVQKRLDVVNDILHHSPYVFLAGHSGVGKSTFVRTSLHNEQTKIFEVSSKERNQFNAIVRQWAEDKSDKRKILFIDEANLYARQWSEFEGLYNKPPTILIDGKIYPLTEQHKVVFAGNPLNYGDERVYASFFARHGNATVFEPLSLECVYELTLKPIFLNTALAPMMQLISAEILKVYQFLSQLSQNEVLITPRELQMMALLVLSHNDHSKVEDIITVAKHYSYLVAKQLVPKEARESFDHQFKPASSLMDIKTPVADVGTAFAVTPSRLELHQQLSDLVALREYRRSNFSKLNESQLYGGLGGIVIEGEPGIGKTEMVINALHQQGYSEVKDDVISDKAYYHIPVNLSFDEKTRLLLRAFNDGAIVLIDEINSSPMMEALLNDLLMGYAPPNSSRPDKPGFMLIGTQNPVTMAGRRAPSAALARRMISTTLPPYTHEEMVSILQKKEVARVVSESMVVAYEDKLKQAIDDNLTPRPTFRDLIRVAKKYVEKTKKEAIKSGWLIADIDLRNDIDGFCQRNQKLATYFQRFLLLKVEKGTVMSNGDKQRMINELVLSTASDLTGFKVNYKPTKAFGLFKNEANQVNQGELIEGSLLLDKIKKYNNSQEQHQKALASPSSQF